MINLLMENGEYNQLAELLSNRNNLHIIFLPSLVKKITALCLKKKISVGL